MLDKNVNKPAQTIVDAVDGEPETEPEDVIRTDSRSTGFALLDRAVNGLPREEFFVAFADRHNHSKSTFQDNLTIGLLQNSDTIVFLHTVDDPLGVRIPRLCGAKFNYPSEYFKRSGYWLKHPDRLPARYCHFDEIYQQAQAWLSDMVSSERLILADVASLAPQLPGLEMWVRSIRAKCQTVLWLSWVTTSASMTSREWSLAKRRLVRCPCLSSG
jgi:hypothetical protein